MPRGSQPSDRGFAASVEMGHGVSGVHGPDRIQIVRGPGGTVASSAGSELQLVHHVLLPSGLRCESSERTNCRSSGGQIRVEPR